MLDSRQTSVVELKEEPKTEALPPEARRTKNDNCSPKSR